MIRYDGVIEMSRHPIQVFRIEFGHRNLVASLISLILRRFLAMENNFTRTSVSTDEAVGILIGWLRGPFDAEVYIDENTDETEWVVFDLAYTLREEEEGLESEYGEAHLDGSTPEIVAQKLAALKRHQKRCKKAKEYLCDIMDELNIGDSSALRIVKDRPDATLHITLSSLDRWSHQKYGFSIFEPPSSSPDAEVSARKQIEPAAPTAPWWIIDDSDPPAAQVWYTPARYFARQLVSEKPSLRLNRNLLAKAVLESFNRVGIKKRGDKVPFQAGTIKKAFVKVLL